MPQDMKKVTLNWSPASEIVWTNGQTLLQAIDSRDDFYKCIEDVSVKMRERARQNYGLDEKYIPEEAKLRCMWSWVRSAKEVFEKFRKSREYDDSICGKLIGIKCILFGIINSFESLSLYHKSDLNYAQWNDFKTNFKVPIYKSSDRSLCLELCDWGCNLDNLLTTLIARGEYPRAAAIALFNLKIRQATEFLKQGSSANPENGGDSYFSTVAMALSGYTGERNSLWREMCSSLRYEIKRPYLRAIFSFLTSETELYEEILYDQNLELSDRVAFACLYLPDKDLKEYIDSYTTMLVEHGSIDGLLLTGISPDGLNLLQHYVEATSDIQTVSFVILHALPSQICKDQRALLWVESYRNILDCWRLWHRRAFFDNEWYKRLGYKETPEPQLFVTCNFCGKSISPLHKYSSIERAIKSGMEVGPHRKISVTAGPQDQRIQSCFNCRKPLPRCCICLTQLGTPAGSFWKKDDSHSLSPTASREMSDNKSKKAEKKLSPMSTWFSWCQTCRHGGHAKHIMDWFNENVECPVSGCSCKCSLLDNDRNSAALVK